MSPSKPKSFTAVLEPSGTRLRWVIARIPFDFAKTWPVRRGLRVHGEISSLSSRTEFLKGKSEGFAFRTALFPDPRGEGKVLVVNRRMQLGASVAVGSKVRIRMEPDLEERAAVVSAELAVALKGDRRLRRWFDGLSYYMRRTIGAIVNEAKSAEARVKRAEKIAEWLLLALEGEKDAPPILKAAFLRQPLARKGWEAMTAAQRRNHLLGIFHYQSAESRELRAAQAVEDALRVAKKRTRGGE